MSEEELRKLRDEEKKETTRQITAEEFRGVAEQYDQAVAIDPGKSSGLAYTDGEDVRAWNSKFWPVVTPFENRPPEIVGTLGCDKTCVILEAPYLSRPGMQSGNSAQAYNSGRVAREAELIEARLTTIGYHVEAFDPARYDSGKWDSDFAHHMVGSWSGPDNGDVRDAIRLLTFYNFI